MQSAKLTANQQNVQQQQKKVPKLWNLCKKRDESKCAEVSEAAYLWDECSEVSTEKKQNENRDEYFQVNIFNMLWNANCYVLLFANA